MTGYMWASKVKDGEREYVIRTVTKELVGVVAGGVLTVMATFSKKEKEILEYCIQEKLLPSSPYGNKAIGDNILIWSVLKGNPVAIIDADKNFRYCLDVETREERDKASDVKQYCIENNLCKAITNFQHCDVKGNIVILDLEDANKIVAVIDNQKQLTVLTDSKAKIIDVMLFCKLENLL